MIKSALKKYFSKNTSTTKNILKGAGRKSKGATKKPTQKKKGAKVQGRESQVKGKPKRKGRHGTKRPTQKKKGAKVQGKKKGAKKQGTKKQGTKKQKHSKKSPVVEKPVEEHVSALSDEGEAGAPKNEEAPVSALNDEGEAGTPENEEGPGAKNTQKESAVVLTSSADKKILGKFIKICNLIDILKRTILNNDMYILLNEKDNSIVITDKPPLEKDSKIIIFEILKTQFESAKPTRVSSGAEALVDDDKNNWNASSSVGSPEILAHTPTGTQHTKEKSILYFITGPDLQSKKDRINNLIIKLLEKLNSRKKLTKLISDEDEEQKESNIDEILRYLKENFENEIKHNFKSGSVNPDEAGPAEPPSAGAAGPVGTIRSFDNLFRLIVDNFEITKPEFDEIQKLTLKNYKTEIHNLNVGTTLKLGDEHFRDGCRFNNEILVNYIYDILSELNARDPGKKKRVKTTQQRIETRRSQELQAYELERYKKAKVKKVFQLEKKEFTILFNDITLFVPDQLKIEALTFIRNLVIVILVLRVRRLLNEIKEKQNYETDPEYIKHMSLIECYLILRDNIKIFLDTDGSFGRKLFIPHKDTDCPVFNYK